MNQLGSYPERVGQRFLPGGAATRQSRPRLHDRLSGDVGGGVDTAYAVVTCVEVEQRYQGVWILAFGFSAGKIFGFALDLRYCFICV